MLIDLAVNIIKAYLIKNQKRYELVTYFNSGNVSIQVVNHWHNSKLLVVYHAYSNRSIILSRLMS